MEEPTVSAFSEQEQVEIQQAQEYVSKLVAVNPQVVWVFKQTFSENFYLPSQTALESLRSKSQGPDKILVMPGTDPGAPPKELAASAARQELKTAISRIVKPREAIDKQERSANWGKIIGFSDVTSSEEETEIRKSRLRIGWWASFQPGHPIQGGNPLLRRVVRIGINDIMDLISEEDFLKYIYQKE